MSKRFYVLYTLKEFYLPRIYKTKATVNKYIEENNKLEFKLFSKEEDAQLFSKSIEVKLEKKFKIKMVEYLQKSHLEIEEINEKSAEREGGENGRKEEGRKEQQKGQETLQELQQLQKVSAREADRVQGKVEVKTETKQEITKMRENTISISPPQKQETENVAKVERQQHKAQQTVIESKKETIEQLKAEVKDQVAVAQEKPKEEKVKSEMTVKQQKKEQIVPEAQQQITHQPSVTPQIKQQDKVEKNLEAIEIAKQEMREQSKEETKIQFKQEAEEQPKEQGKEQETAQLTRQEVNQTATQQAKQEVKESIKQQLKEQPQEVVTIAKEPQIIEEILTPTPLKQETPTIFSSIPLSSHVPNLPLNHLFYPLSPKYLSFLYPKIIKYYNFPSICNLLRFHHLQTTHIPSQPINTPLTLNISLIFKQNPGLSLVILDIESPSLPEEVSYLKTVVLGVKGKEQAKALALIEGLKYASTFGKNYQLTINSNFPSIKNQQRSLDARVRHLFSQYMTQQQSFSRVSYV